MSDLDEPGNIVDEVRIQRVADSQAGRACDGGESQNHWDGKQNRNYRWHKSPALGPYWQPRGLGQTRGPFAVVSAQVAPRGVLLPEVGVFAHLGGVPRRGRT